MDFDTVSNLSQISNQSDDIKSSISSISGLSNYQHEYSELRHYINPERCSEILETRTQISTPINDSGCDLHYEDRISDLSHQLQSTLKQSEQYKNELCNMEMKFEKYNEKIEKLLKVNNKLEIDLANANEQINRLITNYANKREPHMEGVNFIQLEKKFHELSLEHSALKGKYIETYKLKAELDHLHQKISTDLKESQLEIQTKNLCIKDLKEKITKQFFEMQMTINTKNTCVQTLNDSKLELQQTKDMLEWYKKQLEITQLGKKTLAEDIVKYKLDISIKTGKIDALMLELKSLENKFEMYQLGTLKEKERLYQELQALQNCLDNKIDPHVHSKIDHSVLSYHEHIVEDLKIEIESIKNYMNEQDSLMKRTNKENSDLISRCVAAQKMLQNKNLELEEFDLNKKQLLSQIRMLQDEQNEKMNVINILKNEKAKLESEIFSCKQEKSLVDTTINTIREQFTAFSLQYDKLKEELLQKNKQILNLENEKQELFMNNNWKICELEQSKTKENEIDILKKELFIKESLTAEYRQKLQALELDLLSKNAVINENEENYKKEIGRYDEVLIEYKDMVAGYQSKISKLEETIAGTKYLVRDLKDNLNILKNELKRRNLDILNLKTHNENLVQEVEQLSKDKIFVKKNTKIDNWTQIKNCDLVVFNNGNSQTDTTVCDEITQTDEVTNRSESSKTYSVKHKYQKLLIRIKKLENNVLDCKKMLNILEVEKMNLEKDKIELGALLQVRKLNMKENQKK